jgi:hypothetical protein
MDDKEFENLAKTVIIVRAIEKKITHEEVDKDNTKSDISPASKQRLSGVKSDKKKAQ